MSLNPNQSVNNVAVIPNFGNVFVTERLSCPWTFILWTTSSGVIWLGVQRGRERYLGKLSQRFSWISDNSFFTKGRFRLWRQGASKGTHGDAKYITEDLENGDKIRKLRGEGDKIK